ncbi:MAG TPA: DoxX family protein [Rugosimonospora sp.]
MNIALWIVAGLLTAVYLFAGFSKLFTPREKIATLTRAGEWVLDFRAGTVKAIGGFEILGAIGLTLPALLDIAPVLVPLAALGLGLIMTGAVILRIRRHELRYALLDLAYLVLAAFVAFGRFGPEPFTG